MSDEDDSSNPSGSMGVFMFEVVTEHDPNCPLHEANKEGRRRQLHDLADACAARDVKGPAKVVSHAYRANYDTIFGARKVVGEA